MDISEVRKHIRAAIERAQRAAAERRDSRDRASRAFEIFLETTAIPLFRQVANALRADGYLFSVFTPSGSVRLMSDRNSQDFIELLLDPESTAASDGSDTGGTAGQSPRVIGHTSWSRGRRVKESERVIGSGQPEAIEEGELLAFLMKELEPFVER
ncbi:MAG TPA: hypothetical protein VNZ26_08615 [Vicinamibacterales bacterium]|jgi:hypothetical protein|nr:hypothetical protein [Vicinamibacterales bacterium]